MGISQAAIQYELYRVVLLMICNITSHYLIIIVNMPWILRRTESSSCGCITEYSDYDDCRAFSYQDEYDVPYIVKECDVHNQERVQREATYLIRRELERKEETQLRRQQEEDARILQQQTNAERELEITLRNAYLERLITLPDGERVPLKNAIHAYRNVVASVRSDNWVSKHLMAVYTPVLRIDKRRGRWTVLNAALEAMDFQLVEQSIAQKRGVFTKR